MYLWRAVDHEGELLEILVQRRRDKCAAVKLMRKLLRKQGFAPKTVTTDKLRLLRRCLINGSDGEQMFWQKPGPSSSFCCPVAIRLDRRIRIPVTFRSKKTAVNSTP